MSDWLSVEIAIESAPEMSVDILCGALFEAGVSGIEIKDEGSATLVVASIAPEFSRDLVPSIIDQCLEASGLTAKQIAVTTVEPVDWSTHWRHHFHPLGFGKFWVVPSWLEAPEEAEQILVVDPGMAFGTGRHETTSMCLKRIIDGELPPSVLDVGTGTAILAMAAIMCGATRVMGTDNDPDALVVARENAERNGLSDQLRLSDADPDVLGEQFELIIANILRDPLIELAPRIVAAMTAGGRVVLSGILERQVDDVRKAYETCGLSYFDLATDGEWARLEMTKA